MAEESGVDRVTEVTTTSWLQRLGQAIVGVLVGIVVVIGSGVLLFWNEGRAIKTAQGLTEGAGIVRSVSADRIDPGNDRMLIHVSGMLSAGGPVSDGDFALKAESLRLLRQVDMYQWKEETQTETRTKLGGGEERTTTYSYVRTWSDQPIDSTRFRETRGHTNPVMTYRSREALAPGTHLGAFAVPDNLMRGFGTPRPLAATEAQANALQIRIDKPVRVIDGVLYAGRDPAQPAIGDIKVSFAEVPLQTASIVAAQAGSSLAPFPTRTGTTVELISAGAVPAAEMFKEAQEDNVTFTWVLRAVGAFVMFVGFALILRPLSVAADLIPFLGSLVGAGAGLVAMICTAVLAPLVIALGWLWYRPLLAVGIVIAGGAAAYGLITLARRRVARKASMVGA
ncbi:MAG: hypothetical protein BGN99_18620 [Alphaproteobacteria bacterium 65-37]|jgi:hypothetical protein|nr:TMEM43 family protein [Alphaproteobacteria bacterium]OJU39211.1 MAG: hypothetical protein BGN99_18620 [Alphaproteobacteria bacterium 65-37]